MAIPISIEFASLANPLTALIQLDLVKNPVPAKL